MSEAISEMILPGTYIEVRSEGLIGVGGISTGNVGVVGTANRGPLNTAVILGSYGEALDVFGSYDRFPGTDAAPALTLTRTLEQVFKGGGSHGVRGARGQRAGRDADEDDDAGACWPRPTRCCSRSPPRRPAPGPTRSSRRSARPARRSRPP